MKMKCAGHRTGVFVALMLVVACAPKSTYFGPTKLTKDPPFTLGVEPVEGDRMNRLPIRLSLTNRSGATLTFCTGLPWGYEATVNGEAQGYESIISLGGICRSTPLEVDPSQTVKWEDELIFPGVPSGVADLRIEIRIYPLDANGRPHRKEFYELSAYWQAAEA